MSRIDGVTGGQQIIEHDAEATLNGAIEVANRKWLPDIEQAEQREGSDPPCEGRRCEGEHQSECHDLIPHHGAVIGDTKRATGNGADPYAE